MTPDQPFTDNPTYAWDGLTPPYRTIVADPPWDHSGGTGRRSQRLTIGGPPVLVRGITPLPYPVMTVEEITALPVRELADQNAHLYLWVTNRYLVSAYAIAAAWGFDPVKPLVWCKAPKGPFMGGPFGGSSIEFCLYARRGQLSNIGRVGRQWWECARSAHSVKPPLMMDAIEHVSPGPYVELFARAPRLGWDHWGYGYETVKS